MTKSATATPGLVLGHVSTVNIEGSYGEGRGSKVIIIICRATEYIYYNELTQWSKRTALMTMNLLRSYLYG